MATALKNVFSRQGARLEDGRQLSQGRLLVSVSQHQGHCLKVEVDEQRVASLRGPVDQRSEERRVGKELNWCRLHHWS